MITELARQTDFDFLLAAQSNPVIVSQLIAYQALKQCPEWPPENLNHLAQIGDKLNYFLGKITPYMESVEFVVAEEEGHEEEDHEEAGD